jgi:hypothetical protein
MGRSEITSCNHERFAGVADTFQCICDPVIAASSEERTVFKSAPTRSAFADKTDRLKDEFRLVPVNALALAIGGAGVLTRRASDDGGREPSDISNKLLCRESSNVVIKPDLGVVVLVSGTTPRIDFACGDRAESGAMHPKGPPPGRAAE